MILIHFQQSWTYFSIVLNSYYKYLSVQLLYSLSIRWRTTGMHKNMSGAMIRINGTDWPGNLNGDVPKEDFHKTKILKDNIF